MENFYEDRLNICKECGLYKKDFDMRHRCDRSRYLNPETNKTSFLPRSGWVKGCGCVVEVIAANKDHECAAGKW